jgi:ribosomal subunit interface protein
MQIPLKITTYGIDHSDVLETHIRDKAKNLDSLINHATTCHIVVKSPHQHIQHGNQYSVHIDIGVQGSEITVNRDHADDVYIALHDALDAANRKLEHYARRIRGDISKHQLKYRKPGIQEMKLQVIDDR